MLLFLPKISAEGLLGLNFVCLADRRQVLELTIQHLLKQAANSILLEVGCAAVKVQCS